MEIQTEKDLKRYLHTERYLREPTTLDDYTTANITYIRYCYPGMSNKKARTSAIKIFYEKAGEDSYIKWADGNQLFDNVWDNRASLIYLPLIK